MTRKLEELFGLNDDNDETLLSQPIIEPEDPEKPEISQQTLDSIEKIESALPQVRGLEASDAELDELGTLAKEAFNDLLDLGMQVDSRFASEIFNSAGTMLGHAISAKTAKVNKKLKMIDLQLKKAELDRKLSVQAAKEEQANGGATTELGTGSVLDRNDLIKMILSNNASTKVDNKDK